MSLSNELVRLHSERFLRLVRIPATRTHWSTRMMAEVRGYSYGTIARIWRVSGLKPNRIPAPRADEPTVWLVKIGTNLPVESGRGGVRLVDQLQLFVQRQL